MVFSSFVEVPVIQHQISGNFLQLEFLLTLGQIEQKWYQHLNPPK